MGNYLCCLKLSPSISQQMSFNVYCSTPFFSYTSENVSIVDMELEKWSRTDPILIQTSIPSVDALQSLIEGPMRRLLALHKVLQSHIEAVLNTGDMLLGGFFLEFVVQDPCNASIVALWENDVGKIRTASVREVLKEKKLGQDPLLERYMAELDCSFSILAQLLGQNKLFEISVRGSELYLIDRLVRDESKNKKNKNKKKNKRNMEQHPCAMLKQTVKRTNELMILIHGTIFRARDLSTSLRILAKEIGMQSHFDNEEKGFLKIICHSNGSFIAQPVNFNPQDLREGVKRLYDELQMLSAAMCRIGRELFRIEKVSKLAENKTSVIRRLYDAACEEKKVSILQRMALDAVIDANTEKIRIAPVLVASLRETMRKISADVSQVYNSKQREQPPTPHSMK